MTCGEKLLRFRPTALMQRGRAGIALDEHVRRHVVADGAQSGDEAVAADGGEMVNGHGAGKRGVVVDVDVAGQQRAVGDDDVVAQLAVVGDVAAGHQEIVVADAGDAVFLFRGAIDRDALADDVVVADDDLACRCRGS